MKTTRRSFFVVFLTLTLVTASSAEGERIGPNYYVAGVITHQFQYFAAPEMAGRQRQKNWCWAACVQMVLNYHGLYVQQEQVVQRVFNRQVDKPGTPTQILNALSGWAPDYRGRFSEIVATPFLLDGSDIVLDLLHRRPLIVGLHDSDGTGHTYVLTAVYYSVDRYNRLIFDKVVLRDPWPISQSRQEMAWSTFTSKLTFAARVHVHRM